MKTYAVTAKHSFPLAYASDARQIMPRKIQAETRRHLKHTPPQVDWQEKRERTCLCMAGVTRAARVSVPVLLVGTALHVGVRNGAPQRPVGVLRGGGGMVVAAGLDRTRAVALGSFAWSRTLPLGKQENRAGSSS